MMNGNEVTSQVSNGSELLLEMRNNKGLLFERENWLFCPDQIIVNAQVSIFHLIDLQHLTPRA